MKRNVFLGLVLLNMFFTLDLEAKADIERKNIRELFKNNSAIIYTINIRSFGATDKNFDGLINPLDGDIKGTFLNAKNKLEKLKQEGINTIYLLPVTPTGKLKALGNAGSLYALDSFNEINPQLDDETNPMSAEDEAKDFIKKAHQLGLNVIVDLPACGSYDLSLKKPDWFIKDENGETLVPADWTDVRLFKIYNEDGSLYQENLNNFKSFIDFAIELGFDGIRADVAAIKPKEFWSEIIKYARNKNKDFFFLAEANPDWKNPAENGVKKYTSLDELLNAGFDSYYGSWSDFKNVRSKQDFDAKIEQNIKILKKHRNKSMIGAFATHDQQAPMLRGINYWNMILWLNATLPINAYYLDGFSTGDNYDYPWENEPVKYSLTDDEYYFVHSGMFDIFNLSAAPKGRYPKLYTKYLKAINFKNKNASLIKNGNFKLLKTNNDKVFAYSISNQTEEIIVIGSTDENEKQTAQIKSDFLKKDHLFTIVTSNSIPKKDKNIIQTKVDPLELQVFFLQLR